MKSIKSIVYIGMGSSMGNKKNTIEGAFYALQTIDPNAEMSDLYENEAWGGVAKNIFLNAVCRLHTDLSPENLLQRIQEIENAFGRTRNQKWEDRTLDLDILWYGEQCINTSTLMIPHPEIWKRDSVMVPLEGLVSEQEKRRLEKIGAPLCHF